MKHVYHQISGALVVALKPDTITSGNIWSSLFSESVRNNAGRDSTEETATLMMMFDEELPMSSSPSTGKLLILLCSDVYWKNTQRASSTPVMALHDYPQNNGKMP